MNDMNVNKPPTADDIRKDELTKLWIRCPECGTVYERWPKEMVDTDGLPEDNLFDEVLDCYLSHDWTVNSWKAAYENDLVPEQWVNDESSN